MAGRRGNQEGTIRKRADGRWEARFRIAGAKQRSVYGKTRVEALHLMRDALRRVDAAIPLEDPKRTVAQFLDHWLEHNVRARLRPSSVRAYEMHVRVHLVPHLGHVRLSRLTPQHVQQLISTLLQGGRAPSSVVYTRAVLRKALGVALQWELVSRNVAALVDAPSTERLPITPLSVAQAQRLVAAVAGTRMDALYTIALTMGLRQGEILALQWVDIDLTQSSLRVTHTLQRVDGKLQLLPPKTVRSRRTLPLPALVARKLQDRREQQDLEREAAGAAWVETGLVFTTDQGRPLDGVNVTRQFQRVLRREGLPPQRFHDLRHACATFLLAQGISPRVVMETLGHSQISVTMDTYTHVIPQLQVDAAARMDELLTAGDHD